MKTERAPWTCRFAQFHPTTPPPLWLEAWLAQWTCEREGRSRPSQDLAACADCENWNVREAANATRDRSAKL